MLTYRVDLASLLDIIHLQQLSRRSADYGAEILVQGDFVYASSRGTGVVVIYSVGEQDRLTRAGGGGDGELAPGPGHPGGQGGRGGPAGGQSTAAGGQHHHGQAQSEAGGGHAGEPRVCNFPKLNNGLIFVTFID